MKHFGILLIWAIGSLGTSCSSVLDDSTDLAQEQYYPLAIGLERNFQVDSIFFTPKFGGVNIDSSSTLVREHLTDTLRTLTKELAFRVERYERRKSSDPWVLRKVFTEMRSGQRLIRDEDNLPLIKMIFPLQVQQKWNSTAYLDPTQTVKVRNQFLEIFKGWESNLTEWQNVWQMNGKTYEQTLNIQTADYENALELRKGMERYARGLGLIYRELQVLDTQCINCQGQTWERKAQRGFILRQRRF
jgi:hypothetical protein